MAENSKDFPKHVSIYKDKASTGVMSLYYLNRILAGDLESEGMALAVSFTWKRIHLFVLTNDKTQVLITATASSSPVPDSEVRTQAPWRQKVQVGIHSKKNIFLQKLASSIYAPDTLTSRLTITHGKMNTLFILWFLCSSSETFLGFSQLCLPGTSGSYHHRW